MDYISEYITRKIQNQKIVQSLPINVQKHWLDFLTESDKKESSIDRRNRRKTVSLDYKIKDIKTDSESTILDLYIDDSPTSLEKIIQSEEEVFIQSQLPKLEQILSTLSDLDRNIILLYFENDKIPSFREMGRKLNVDYRKIQRRIPKIMKYITNQLQK